MTERQLHGLVVSGGVAVGPAFVLFEPVAETGAGGAEAALAALSRVAAELGRTAERLVAQGRETDAEIIEANRLMAEDPSLAGEVAALAAVRSPAEALRLATEGRAGQLAALHDPLLAARAADVRELGRRAVRALSGAAAVEPPAVPSVVVASELGPAEIVDLRLEEGLVLGFALADGSATSHAAIMARSLGVPMVAGLGAEVLAARTGDTIVLDGALGTAVLQPGPEALKRAQRSATRELAERARLAVGRTLPTVTRSGRSIRLLANASTCAEAEAALSRGAEGAGLVRTELAFLDWDGWPSEAEHGAALRPVLEVFAGRVATVRTLDFGADKTPPFLAGQGGRGIQLMLEREDALEAQLAAILEAGTGTLLRVMLPLVESALQVRRARALLQRAARRVGQPEPLLGAMVETPAAAHRASELALEADFFSIGTNDLVATTLGIDRDAPGASPLSAGDPAVVELIRQTLDAAHAAGIPVEICGEAAGEPALTPLFVGLGVDELSVAPSRLDAVRDAIRRSGEPGDEVRQLGDGLGGVVA